LDAGHVNPTKAPPVHASHGSNTAAMEQPFPLRRLFRRRFIPAFAAFLGVLLVLVAVTADRVAETIYLRLAERRAETIVRAVGTDAPAAWGELMQGRSTLDLDSPDEVAQLTQAFADEVRELALSDLKVYDLDRRVLFSVEMGKVGTREEGPSLRSVIDEGESVVDRATGADGTAQYELYVPFHDDGGNLRAVFELYEPVGYLNTILLWAAIPALIVPGVFLLVLALALDRLVGAAQKEIDARTGALHQLRRRMETFLSNSAVSAAQGAKSGHAIASQELVTTLLYSDIRDFTGFAETVSAEAVVAFLNDIMAAQVAVVAAHDGDVDKLIGDALLARFDGPTGGDRAIAAARDILRTVARGDYPRGLGIGVYRGKVILGSIGPEERRDFTVIGDSVNMSARLCSAAGAGELVADGALADDDFGPLETIRVKGRSEPLEVRRWKTSLG
jgi:adenylate cyclase